MTEAAPAQAATTTTTASDGGQARSALLSGGATTTTTSGATNGTTTAPETSNSTTSQQAPAGGDWRAIQGLDEETGKVWNNLSARYTSQADLAKAHVSLVQSMDKRIPIPAPDAKPEEWDQVYNKLGRPEKADGYKFEFKETDPWDDGQRDHIKGLAPLFHRARATQAQVDEFVRQQAELDKVAIDAARAKTNTLSQQRMRQLQTEWAGEDFKRNQNLVATTVRNYAGGDSDEIATLRLDDGTFAVDHPALARMFAKIGAERAEDDRDPTAFNGGLRANAKDEIERLESEAKSKGLSPSDRDWPHAKLDALYGKAYGKTNQFGR